ncbi:neutrophil collagenase [Lasius niger]|uniref:Neutrophil collagenase n=1 Tax=Lasius niger TaxID=67767 RepID=A0A0J7KBV5_LASNI|nr:neutrophil collagenase [Lasius niger]KMQ87767.1 neutrophil collagenase [Lasius niger]
MYAFVPSSGNQFSVKLSIEDILAVQNLYGPKNEKHVSTTTTTIPITTTTIAPTTTTMITPDNLSDTDLCALRHLDTALILNRRMYIARQHTVWSVSLNERIYGKPMLPDYMRFLPANFTSLSAVYQRPSGDLALFVDNSIYMVENPSFTLRQGWPQTLADIRLPPNAKINAAINTNTGRTFVIYDNDKVAEIDECTMMATKHSSLQEIFLGIPSAVTSAFRHIDGNLFFFAKHQFYVFNEFTNNVIIGGPFDLYALGIECPRNGLLLQVRDLLDRIYRIGDVFASDTTD